MTPQVDTGSPVTLVGLSSRPDLNGRRGVVLSRTATAYRVSLGKEEDQVLVLRKNIQPTAAADSDNNGQLRGASLDGGGGAGSGTSRYKVRLRCAWWVACFMQCCARSLAPNECART